MKPNNELAAEILSQVAGEADARKDYELLLADYGVYMASEDVDTIREIQADEANHIQRLLAMVKKYDGGIEPAKDA